MSGIAPEVLGRPAGGRRRQGGDDYGPHRQQMRWAVRLPFSVADSCVLHGLEASISATHAARHATKVVGAGPQARGISRSVEFL
jgi:hypothetical protein